MTTLKGAEVERFIAKPDARFPMVLVFGPDTGLVAERARLIAQRAVGENAEAFQLVQLDGDDVAGDPLRLVDEANAIGLFGGKRAIRVRAGARNIVPALEALVRVPPLGATIIVEAGDLNAKAPLRALFEKTREAAAIPCYLDGPEAVRRLVGDTMRAAGLRLAPDALDVIVASLGGDRLATRAELEKLVTYAAGESEITLDDVEAIVGDVAANPMMIAIDAAFAGELRTMAPVLRRLAAEGERPDGVLMAALAHAWILAQGLEMRETGMAPKMIAERLMRYFKRQPAFVSQLDAWRGNGMVAALRMLGDALYTVRTTKLAWSAAERALFAIAKTAKSAR